MGAWKMTLVSFWGPFSTSMIMGGRVEFNDSFES